MDRKVSCKLMNDAYDLDSNLRWESLRFCMNLDKDLL